VSVDWFVQDFGIQENKCVLRRELPKPEVLKPQRDKVVGHGDVTWFDVDTWDVCHVSVGFEPMDG
jgi:hypothetical protein